MDKDLQVIADKIFAERWQYIEKSIDEKVSFDSASNIYTVMKLAELELKIKMLETKLKTEKKWKQNLK